MNVKIVNKSKHPLPSYATTGSAGMDLRANIEGFTWLNAGERMIVPTGIYIQLPENCVALITPRSGLAAKNGITVTNSPGVIDEDYTGEIKVILHNTDPIKPFEIKDGDRIAQMLIMPYLKAEWILVEDLDITERGQGGFGHTGK